MRVRPPLVILVLAASLALMGGVSGAKPAPAPSASPTAPPPPPAVAPSVVVYPFEVDSELPPKSGQQVAQIFDQQISQAGGVTVLPSPAGIPRTDYLKAAQKNNADFYVSGYLTAVGDGAAMVLQVVSTASGAMVFSHTAQVTNAAQASAEALTAREVILARSGLLSRPDQAPPKATPAPTTDNGANVSIGNLFGIFKHRHAGPPVVAAADKPPRVVIVARVSGSDFVAAAFTAATQTLSSALNRSFKVQPATALSKDLASTASDVCGVNRNATIAGGTLAQVHSGKKTQASFTLRIYTCFGAVLYEGTATSRDVNDAVTSAVGAYATAHPQNS